MEPEETIINDEKSYSILDFMIESLSFIDKTPLKYIGSGYWIEKYGLEAKRLIEDFETQADRLMHQSENIDYDLEIGSLISEYENKLRRTTIKGYGSVMAIFCPLASVSVTVGIQKALEMYTLINDSIATPYLGESVAMVGSSGLILLGSFILHDFACPSSIRKCLEYAEIGDHHMARIINGASFSPLKEFERVTHYYLKD